MCSSDLAVWDCFSLQGQSGDLHCKITQNERVRIEFDLWHRRYCLGNATRRPGSSETSPNVFLGGASPLDTTLLARHLWETAARRPANPSYMMEGALAGLRSGATEILQRKVPAQGF